MADPADWWLRRCSGCGTQAGKHAERVVSLDGVATLVVYSWIGVQTGGEELARSHRGEGPIGAEGDVSRLGEGEQGG